VSKKHSEELEVSRENKLRRGSGDNISIWTSPLRFPEINEKDSFRRRQNHSIFHIWESFMKDICVVLWHFVVQRCRSIVREVIVVVTK
jgi:hypothetical protein